MKESMKEIKRGSPLYRALAILKVMKGRTILGLSLSQIAEQIGTSSVNTLRVLDVLVEQGFMQKLDTGNYALSTHFMQIAVEYQREMQKARERLEQLEQRVEAGSW